MLHCHKYIYENAQTVRGSSEYLAIPPFSVASTTCSLSMRNMNTARFYKEEKKCSQLLEKIILKKYNFC